MYIRIKYFCLRTDKECVDDNFILGDVANILLLLLLLRFINKIHSYFFFHSYTDARVEATNRINTRIRQRDREKVYARMLSSVYDSRVNEILIWQKSLRCFQHENIPILPNTISIIIALFDQFMLELNPIVDIRSIWLNVYVYIHIFSMCKRRWQLFYWYSMLNILNDDVRTHFNKKITSKHI
jgi:hypothetical protein